MVVRVVPIIALFKQAGFVRYAINVGAQKYRSFLNNGAASLLKRAGGVWIGDHLGLPRDFILRVPSILADGALTFLVIDALERRGASGRLVFGAASLVAFGPMFLAVSSYQGQIDTLAILPAATAVLLWSRPRTPARAVVCGSLIGIGAALKTVPGFMVLALLATARSTLERADRLLARRDHIGKPLDLEMPPFRLMRSNERMQLREAEYQDQDL